MHHDFGQLVEGVECHEPPAGRSRTRGKVWKGRMFALQRGKMMRGSRLRLAQDELSKRCLQTCLLSRASGVGIGLMRGSFVVDMWLKCALLHVHFHKQCLPI